MATSRKAKLLPAKKPAAKKPAAKKPLDLKGLGSGGAKSALGSVQKRRALLIGINHYKELTSLQYAVRDVKAIKDALEGFRYEDIQILHDEAGPKQKPTYKNVVRELEEFAERAERDDLLLVYFAGHGKMKDDKAWLLLADSKWNEKKQWYDQVLSVEKLKSLLKRGASERLVLMLDACQTGEVGERDTVDPSERARFIRRAYEEAQGVAVLASSSPGQKAQEIKELGHGVFTHFVLDGLKDKSLVDERSQLLTVSRLAAHVTQNLSRWNERKSVYVQLPRLQLDGGDLALVDHTQEGIWTPDERPFTRLRELRRLEGHQKGKKIRHIAVSPNGSRFLTVSDDGTARLWNAKTGKLEGKPYRHPAPVSQASFFVGGKQFVTLSEDDVIRYWEIGTTRPMILAKQRSSTALAFTPSGRHLVVGTRSAVRFVAGTDDEVSFSGHEGSVRTIALLGSPTLMATGADDGTVLLRDYEAQELIQMLYFPVEGAKGAILSVALSPNGRLLAIAGQDPRPDSGPLQQVPHVWGINPRVGGGRLIELHYYLREHTQAVTVVQFSPVGHVLLSASRDGTARLWRASDGTLLQTLDEPRIPITAGAFSVDGERVILGYEDGTVRIFGPEAPSTSSKGRKKT